MNIYLPYIITIGVLLVSIIASITIIRLGEKSKNLRELEAEREKIYLDIVSKIIVHYESKSSNDQLEPSKQSEFYRLINEININDDFLNLSENEEVTITIHIYALISLIHEFRTPLNALIGFSELILKDGNSVDEYKEYAQLINKTSQGLKYPISDLKDAINLKYKNV